jgi:bacillopeptidase F
MDQSNSDQMHKIIVALANQADIYALDDQLRMSKAMLGERNFQVITALQEVATATQPEVLSFIEQLAVSGQAKNVKSFWLANLIALEATPAAINALANLDAVGKIAIDYPIELIEPIENAKPAENENLIASVEQGLVAIHAPEAWALGYTGAGRVVSNLDTGVDGTHQRPFSW